MINSIIPKFLFNEEDIIYLRDKGLQITEGNQIVGEYKVPCYKFFNMNEIEVFDTLEGNKLYEDVAASQKAAYANRVSSTLFLRIRQAITIKNKDQKIAASCALLAAVNSLASLDISYANRFLPLVRSMVS